ncbi:MAG: CHC2 zinc finger domain-containing protein [Bacteroidales bacterium]|jgi:DNA primase|nr:CHC2 zinc finger domain-containing protein [Bacteroidales bacterium]
MEINEIKSRLSIQAVLAHYGLATDRNHRLLCPFHTDKTPSLQVYPKTNTWTCFSSNCTAGSGDAIEFIRLKEKITKHEAIVKAQQLLGNREWKMDHEKAKSMITAKEPAEVDYDEWFPRLQSARQKSAKARDYLKSRNLDQAECGFNTGKEMDGMKHCVIFPLKNQGGTITGLYGRSTVNNDTSKHYYSAHRSGLYPGYPSGETTRLILTEAVIDAATLEQLPEIAAEYVILACYGTNGLTPEHKEAIKGLKNLKEIVLFFDGDDPGREAVGKQATTLKQLCPEILISAVDTPEGEDVNSLSISHSPEIFAHLLETRKDFFLSTEESSMESKEDPQAENPVAAVLLNTPAPKLNTTNSEYITFATDGLQMALLGGVNLGQLDRLRVTVKIRRSDSIDPLHSVRQSVDLYHAEYLDRFIARASERLEVSVTVLTKALAQLTEQVEQYRLSRIESLKERKPDKRQLTQDRIQRAVNYLKSSDLMERTWKDLGLAGVVGQENNRLLMYLVFTSRLRENPLHIISLGSSGAGKTYLQEKISELIPDQDKLEITMLSENAFYYFEQNELRHKLVLIEDLDGAEAVLYPLRELQTKRKISKTIPVKDSKGNLKTVTLHVEGPICVAGTTTKERLYEDNANRSLLIYVDGSPEHRERIMEYQRRLSAGRINPAREERLKELFRDAQSVLKPVGVRNPYAEYLKLPEQVFKPLRTNAHYLAFIETVTFYCQYQRSVKRDPESGQGYVETTLEDIAWANRLLREVLLTKSDELPHAVREFFEGLKAWVKKEKLESFCARDLQQRLRMYPVKVNRYLHELESRWLIRRVGGNRKSGFEYQVHRWEEYSRLTHGVDVLDQVLEDLKAGRGMKKQPAPSQMEV